MFGRLRLFNRIILIILLFCLALFALAIGLSFVAKKDQSSAASRFPIPDQSAAIIDLIDSSSPEKLDITLRAIKTPELAIEIVSKQPEGFSDLDRMPGLEWLVKQYLETFQDRKVIAVRDISQSHNLLVRFFDRFDIKSKTPVNIAVELKDGRFAILKVRKATRERIFGIPIGFWIGFYGFLFAGFALWAIAREAKPLRQLSDNVKNFGIDVAPRFIKPKGAPEIKELISATNAMQERISTLIKARSVLLGAISHDLKTYITRLRLRVEDIPDETKQEKAVKDLEDMSRIINDSIAIARGNGLTDRYDDIDIVQILQEDIAARDIDTISFETDNEPHITKGDLTSIRRLFANLIDNAMNYAEKATVTVKTKKGHHCILIDDNGPGIPDYARKNIFEPFYRIENSRSRATGGSGLGLAIVKQIVDSHHGSVEISDSPMGGACFIVTLPQRYYP